MWNSCMCLALAVLLSLGGAVAIQTYFMENHCGKEIDISTDNQINLKTVETGNHWTNYTCLVTIKSTYGYQMMIYFKDINLGDVFECTFTYLEILDGKSKSSPNIGYETKFCGDKAPNQVYATTGQYLTLYFSSQWQAPDQGFDLVITEFQAGLCYSWEHKCKNGRCIDESLVCNEFNPCGDGSDCQFDIALIIGPVIGGVSFVLAVLVIVILTRRRQRIDVVPAYDRPQLRETSYIPSTYSSYGSLSSYNYGEFSASVPYQQHQSYVDSPPPYGTKLINQP